jgi:Uma2 family endonuclease
VEVNEAAPKYYPKMSPFEFLEWEREQEYKHEYVNGEVLAMAGASFKHNLIATNVIGLVGTFLRGKQCNILTGDLRVSVKFKNSFFYPDAAIVCDEPEFDDDKTKDTLRNPVVIFEILSPSTEDYDMGRKQMYYMQVESLKQYILIDSQSVLVRVITKQEEGAWKFTELTNPQDKIFIESISFETTVEDLYEGMKL